MPQHASSSPSNKSQSSSKSNTNRQEFNSPSPSPSGGGNVMQMQRSLGNRAFAALFGSRQGSTSGGTQTPQSPTQTQTPQPPTPSPTDVRKKELEDERDAIVTDVSTDSFRKTFEQISLAVRSYLTSNGNAAALRDSLTKKAEEQVHANIEVASTDENVRADAKKYTAEAVAASGAVAKVLADYAKDTTGHLLPDSFLSQFSDKALQGYNTVAASPSQPLDKQLKAARTAATSSVQSLARDLARTKTADAEKSIPGIVKSNPKMLDLKVDAGDAGKAEAEKRQRLDGSIGLDDTVIDDMYAKRLYEPLKEAALMKLGVGRGAWRRSDELNAFRDSMKTAAREQASTEIDSQLDTHQKTQSKSSVGKKYFGMLAKSKAYDLAKGSVNSIMETEAETIADRVLTAHQAKDKLRAAAKSAAYDIARTNATDTKKLLAAARSGAKNKSIELLKDLQTKTVAEARAITKGTKATSSAPATSADTARQGQLKDDVREQVTTDEVAKKSIDAAIEADSLNSGFTKLAKMVDFAVPSNGDSVSYEIELKIPVYGGSYCLFGLAGEAGRDDDEVELSNEFTFGAGFTTWGLDASFRAGFYIESSAKTATGAINLMSYGVYREMRNKVPKAADYFWGRGGKSGMSELEEAELWASMIEQQEMTDDTGSVDIGVMAALKASANAKVAKFEGELGYKRLSRYDKETIERLGGATAFGDQTDLSDLAKKAQSIGKGEIRNVIEAAAEVETSAGGVTFGIGLEGALTIAGGRLRELEIAAKGTIPFVFGEEALNGVKIASKIVTPAVGAAKSLSSRLIGMHKDRQASGSGQGGKDHSIAKTGGTLTDMGTDVMFAVPGFEDAGKSLAESIQGDETINDTIRSWLPGQESGTSATETANKVGLQSSLEISIGFNKEWDHNGLSKEWEVSLEVNEVKGLEVDLEVAKFSVEKSKRLAKFGVGRERNKTTGQMEWGGSAEALGFKTGGD